MLTVGAQASESARALAQACIKISRFDAQRTWVLLNFPRRSSLTLYMGPDPAAAQLIADAAKKVIAESAEYLLASAAEDDAPLPAQPAVSPWRCCIKQGAFDRWLIVNSENHAWSGKRWVPASDTGYGFLTGGVQVCNFGSKEAAEEYAREFGFVIGGEL
jgi:hypothetical protein